MKAGMAAYQRGDYRRANVIKNTIVSVNSIVAGAVFVWQGAVFWLPALVMMAGALVGGILGARIAQVVPRSPMRMMVVIVGTLLTASFAWRNWLSS